MNPKITVVIPTYYRNEMLEEAIRSTLDQSFDNLEVIVVDDSGEHHAEPVVSQFDDVRYLAFDQNRGAQQARTAGIEEASGDYVQLLDDDDVLKREKFARQMEVLERRPEVGVVYCGVEWEDGSTTLPRSEIRGDVLEYVLGFRAFPCITSTMLTRRSLLLELLPLRDLPGGDDLSLKIRLAKRTDFDYVDAPLVLRRLSDDSRGDVLARGPLEGRRILLEEHADLYAEHDREVLGYALASVYRREGKQRLERNRWSAAAIRSFWQLNRAYPGIRLDFVGLLLGSILGAPGVRFGRWLFHRMRQTELIGSPSQ
jgi:glycosyltransferase involved in cell wall biosynthesis